jgi:hypothetical protein
MDFFTTFLTTTEFAALADIDDRNARKAFKRCLDGKEWNGHALAVRKRGRAYELNVLSLPPDLYAKWLEAQPKPPAPVAEPVQLPATLENRHDKLAAPESIEEAKWKRALIEPALSHPARSRARGSVIKDIAARKHTKPCGKSVRIAERTLFQWLERYESDGLQGLVRQRRREEARVLITKKWDSDCPLPADSKSSIKAATCGVEIDGQWYENDVFSKGLRTQKITLRYASWAPERIVYAPNFPDPEGATWIDRAKIYHPHDLAGARDSSARNGTALNHISSLKAEIVPLDMADVMARDNAARPPAPVTLFGGPKISLGIHVDQLAGDAKRLGPPAPQEVRQLMPGESVDRETGEVTSLLANIPGAGFKQRKKIGLLDMPVQIHKKQGVGQ